MLHLKRILLVNFIICFNCSFAQKKIDVTYYINNTKLPIENVRIFLVTKTDTIIPKITKGRLQISSELTDNFSAFAQINGKTVKIGSFRPATFEEIDGIIIGEITDFSILKKSWEFRDTYCIGKENLITIPNSQNITDLIFSIIRKDIDVSLNTDVTDFIPAFTSSYEVIKTKD